MKGSAAIFETRYHLTWISFVRKSRLIFIAERNCEYVNYAYNSMQRLRGSCCRTRKRSMTIRSWVGFTTWKFTSIFIQATVKAAFLFCLSDKASHSLASVETCDRNWKSRIVDVSCPVSWNVRFHLLTSTQRFTKTRANMNLSLDRWHLFTVTPFPLLSFPVRGVWVFAYTDPNHQTRLQNSRYVLLRIQVRANSQTEGMECPNAILTLTLR